MEYEIKNSFYFLCLFLDQETVRLVDGKYPEVWLNGTWSPICGHYFWDNDYGATMFCKQLNATFDSGIVIRRPDKPLESDAIRVGKCQNDTIDTQWLQCTGACNDLGKGNGCAMCGAGELASIEIECSQSKIERYQMLFYMSKSQNFPIFQIMEI